VFSSLPSSFASFIISLCLQSCASCSSMLCVVSGLALPSLVASVFLLWGWFLFVAVLFIFIINKSHYSRDLPNEASEAVRLFQQTAMMLQSFWHCTLLRHLVVNKKILHHLSFRWFVGWDVIVRFICIFKHMSLAKWWRVSSQVTFIYITLLTIQIVSKQLQNIKIGK